MLKVLAIFAAGVGAGTINTIVGSGSLITFPTLLAFGYPAVGANISNNIGVLFGSVSGTVGYRAELSGQRDRVLRLAPASALGSAAGAVLLLTLPADAFRAIVPILIALALVLVIAQPRLQARMRGRRAAQAAADAAGTGMVAGPGPGRGLDRSSGRGHTLVAVGGVFGAGIYGGYFGAAQGVLLTGLLGSLLPESLQRVNALKNVLALVVNAVAAVVFMAVSWHRIEWPVVLVLAIGSTIGGVLGARVGRRLPAPVLRGVIVTVGLVAIVRLLA